MVNSSLYQNCPSPLVLTMGTLGAPIYTDRMPVVYQYDPNWYKIYCSFHP